MNHKSNNGFIGGGLNSQIKNKCTNIELRLVITAIAFLLVGVMVYLFDRPSGSTSFIPMSYSFNWSLFGSIGEHIPTFVHVYAFILLSAVVVHPSKQNYLYISLMWLVIDAVFELAQHAVISSWLEASLPIWIQHLPGVFNIIHHLSVSTFDLYDLCSIFVGAIAGYITLLFALFMRKRKINVF